MLWDISSSAENIVSSTHCSTHFISRLKKNRLFVLLSYSSTFIAPTHRLWKTWKWRKMEVKIWMNLAWTMANYKKPILSSRTKKNERRLSATTTWHFYCALAVWTSKFANLSDKLCLLLFATYRRCRKLFGEFFVSQFHTIFVCCIENSTASSGKVVGMKKIKQPSIDHWQ